MRIPSNEPIVIVQRWNASPLLREVEDFYEPQNIEHLTMRWIRNDSENVENIEKEHMQLNKM